MKKIIALVLLVLLSLSLTSCKKSNVIYVCASDVPHAEVLEGKVKDILKKKGYKLEVTILDWTLQNDAVANKDYDANYFQHVPYLETYNGDTKLFATCKVHYEPLGIYYGKAPKVALDNGSYVICDDVSNAIRAFELLTYKGVINKTTEGENYPFKDDKLSFTGNTWTSKDKKVTVTLVAENLLVACMGDYDYACLPCNTALTGNISSARCVSKEDDKNQVALKANVLACRLDDYNNDKDYKAKIDVLTDALLSSEVSEYFNSKYNGVITCDSSSQIDLRNSK